MTPADQSAHPCRCCEDVAAVRLEVLRLRRMAEKADHEATTGFARFRGYNAHKAIADQLAMFDRLIAFLIR